MTFSQLLLGSVSCKVSNKNLSVLKEKWETHHWSFTCIRVCNSIHKAKLCFLCLIWLSSILSPFFPVSFLTVFMKKGDENKDVNIQLPYFKVDFDIYCLPNCCNKCNWFFHVLPRSYIREIEECRDFQWQYNA